MQGRLRAHHAVGRIVVDKFRGLDSLNDETVKGSTTTDLPVRLRLAIAESHGLL